MVAAAFSTIITGNGTTGNNVLVGGDTEINLNRTGSTFGGTAGTFNDNTIQFNNLTIGANTLTVSNNNRFVLQFAGTTTLTGNASFNAVGLLTLSGVVGENGASYGFTKLGAGTLTLSNANTYTGATTINVGTVNANNAGVVGISSALGKNSAVTIANAANTNLALGANLQIGSLAGGGTTGGNVQLAANTLTTGADNSSTAYGGVISGTGGSLTKIGTGAQTLTGINTFTGAVTIGTSTAGATTQTSRTANGGTLIAGGNGALGRNTTGAATVAVNNGGSLLLSGATTIGTTPGGVSDRVTNNAAITLGTSGGTGVGGTIGLTGTGPILEGTARSTTNGGGTTTASPFATGANTSVVGLGALTLASSSTLDFSNTVGTLVFTSLTVGNFKLNITNYSNTTANGSMVSGVDGIDDRLIFSQDQATNIANGVFNFNGSFAGVFEIPLDSGFYEVAVAPVPEPATIFGGLLTMGALGWSQRRRLRVRW